MSFLWRLPFLSNDTAGKEPTGRNTLDELESLKQRLLTTVGYLKCVQSNVHVTVSSLVVAAVVWMSELPTKLNPIILPLMASSKREQEEILQNMAAETLVELVSHYMARKPSPSYKLIKNICSLRCTSYCETPQATVLSSIEIIEDQDLLSFRSSCSKQKSKVLMLASGEDQSSAEGFISRRGCTFYCTHAGRGIEAKTADPSPCIFSCIHHSHGARALSPPVGLSEGLSRSKEDAQFLEQLVDNSHIDDYKIESYSKGR